MRSNASWHEQEAIMFSNKAVYGWKLSVNKVVFFLLLLLFLFFIMSVMKLAPWKVETVKSECPLNVGIIYRQSDLNASGRIIKDGSGWSRSSINTCIPYEPGLLKRQDKSAINKNPSMGLCLLDRAHLFMNGTISGKAPSATMTWKETAEHSAGAAVMSVNCSFVTIIKSHLPSFAMPLYPWGFSAVESWS